MALSPLEKGGNAFGVYQARRGRRTLSGETPHVRACSPGIPNGVHLSVHTHTHTQYTLRHKEAESRSERARARKGETEKGSGVGGTHTTELNHKAD